LFLKKRFLQKNIIIDVIFLARHGYNVMRNKDLYCSISAGGNDLPVFHKSWWLDAVCKDWDAVVVKNGDNVAGVWPYSRETKAGIKMSRQPPLTPYLGPHAFYPHDLKNTRRDNYEHETVRGLAAHLPPLPVWNISCMPGLKQVGLLQELKFNTNFRQTFVADLTLSDNDLLSGLHTDFRRSIRKAADELAIENLPGCAGDLFRFQAATLERKGTGIHYSPQLLEQLISESVAQNSGALWVAKKRGVIEAILWNLWDATRSYYLVGAKNPEVRDNHAMTMLIWHSMMHCKSLGKASFDFEGSMIPGVERFFRNFGGKRELYPVLQKNDSLLWRLIRYARK